MAYDHKATDSLVQKLMTRHLSLRWLDFQAGESSSRDMKTASSRPRLLVESRLKLQSKLNCQASEDSNRSSSALPRPFVAYYGVPRSLSYV